MKKNKTYMDKLLTERGVREGFDQEYKILCVTGEEKMKESTKIRERIIREIDLLYCDEGSLEIFNCKYFKRLRKLFSQYEVALEFERIAKLVRG